MNLYEIRLEDNLITNDTLLEAFLFDCQCSLFLVDGKNKESTNSVKVIMKKINNEKYPFMKRLIVENKSDIIPEEENEEIKKLLNYYPFLDNIKISLKTGNNLENLLIQIYDKINSNSSEENLFPLDKVNKYTTILYQKEEYEGSISLMLLGDGRVGKSNFMTRYANNKFSDEYLMTVGYNEAIKTLKIDNKNIYQLRLVDTAGQERYMSMPRNYYKNSDGILLLYDVESKESFKNIEIWMNDIKEYTDKKDDNIVIYLIGNKIDLIYNDNNNDEEKVTKEEIEELANSLKVKYYDTSRKWNLNIEEVMARIILDCLKNNRFKKMDKNKQNENNSGGCCGTNKNVNKNDENNKLIISK
jgi:small GTP-binding protein